MIERISILVVFFLSVQQERWKPIIVNAQRKYQIKEEGKLLKPEDILSGIDADLIIDDEASASIRLGYSFPLGDTTVIQLFETSASYHNLFDIVIFKDQYLIRYSREINDTDFVQKFVPLKTKLELNCADFSNGSKIRGYVEYSGSSARKYAICGTWIRWNHWVNTSRSGTYQNMTM